MQLQKREEEPRIATEEELEEQRNAAAGRWLQTTKDTAEDNPNLQVPLPNCRTRDPLDFSHYMKLIPGEGSDT